VIDDVVIRKVREPYGWLGNMSPHPVGLWRTAEHAFQALRFADTSDVRKLIMDAPRPMAAKMIAKAHVAEMIVQPRSEQDLANMRRVLGLKLDQHPLLMEALRATGNRHIVEDCTARANDAGLFWGAALHADGTWHGTNMLGVLWMELRATSSVKSAEQLSLL
jgi:predicted NAD-dependent protein-ADP-ribosyltransferase YbiA (DUF1768 family)